MKQTVADYILKNYVRSTFMEKFCNHSDKETEMYISVGKKFGYKNEAIKPMNPSDYYFYDMVTSLGTLNVCYIGYDNLKFSGVYMTKDKQLVLMDFRTHKAKYLTVEDLTESQLEKYNGYDTHVIDTTEYMLLDIIDGKTYFYDINGTIVDEDKQEVLETDINYQRCQDDLKDLIDMFS